VGQKGTQQEQGLCFLYGEGNENHQLGTGISVHHRIVLTVKK
jgi:hypothetical protein